MAIEWEHEKPITEFVPVEAMTYLLPVFSERPLEVRVRFVSNWIYSSRPVLCIEIEDDTTLENIHASWVELKRLRRELNQTRGPWDRSGGGVNTIFYLIERKRAENGETWPEIAAWVNLLVKRSLEDEETPDLPSYRSSGLDPWQWLEWFLGGKGTNWKEELAGLTAKDVQDDYPVTGDHVKARWRTWHDRYRPGE